MGDMGGGPMGMSGGPMGGMSGGPMEMDLAAETCSVTQVATTLQIHGRRQLGRSGDALPRR